MSEQPSQWVSQTDIAGRLRLLRYGLIVAVIVIFLVTWLVPYVIVNPLQSQLADAANVARETNPDVPEVDTFTLGDSLVWGLAAAVITAIIAVIVYFVYREILKRAAGG
ncbi:MAG: hypothetical protein M5R40_29340 [Anaerolineae bacterium]|nr:hypothetical protein [Anaerolineae bacterium]